MVSVMIPQKFEPRGYQLPLLEKFDEGIRRFFLFWHRRAGKDYVLFALMAREAWRKRGLYYYFFPTYTQAKKVIWEGMTHEGRPFLDLIPSGLIKSQSNQELRIELTNGSIIRLIGTDNYDAVRGTNPLGCVFSEFAYQNPMAWEVVSPILTMNGGWALFNTTPNGKNHAARMYDKVRHLDYWYTEKLTIDDTKTVPYELIQQERESGKEEVMIQQEYYCVIGELLGAIFGKEVGELEKSGRFCAVPYEPNFKVDVFFDLGRNDTTSIGFVQEYGKEIRFIDYYQGRFEDISHYVEVLRDLNYNYGTIWLPHDGFHKRIEAKLSCAEQFTEAEFKVKMVPMASIEHGTMQLRKLFKRIYLSKTHCQPLLDAFENYRREYDDLNKTFKKTAVHDWSSHPVDMARYMAVVKGVSEKEGQNDIESYRELHEEYLANSISSVHNTTDEMQAYAKEHQKLIRSLHGR